MSSFLPVSFHRRRDPPLSGLDALGLLIDALLQVDHHSIQDSQLIDKI
jgi:hypothetical protein